MTTVPGAQADKLTEFVLKSVRKFLDEETSGYTGVHISSPDFQHDEVPGTPPTPRTLPYVTLVHGSDETGPYEIGDKRKQRNINFQIWVQSEDFLASLRRPQQIEQLLITTTVSGIKGAIPLFDFDIAPPSGVGHIEIRTSEILPLTDLDEKEKWRNLKHTQVISCRIEEEKVATAKLLE